MKHTWKVTTYLVLLFLSTQLLGTWLLSKNVHVEAEDGKIVLQHGDTVLGPRPEMTGAGSFLYIFTAVIIGTILLLILIRYKKIVVWKVWYGLACFLTLSIALGVLLQNALAFLLAAILTGLKIFKQNIYTHNLTEILIYSGIGVFLAPLLDVVWGAVLLVIVSFYDMYAVWKSKHMVAMAQFQNQTKMFAGLSLPYKTKPRETILTTPARLKAAKGEPQNAILGGGDLAFPLIFTGAAMESLLLAGKSTASALGYSSLVIAGSTIALLLLFMLAKRNKFYPAMPILTLGCFAGYAVMMLV